MTDPAWERHRSARAEVFPLIKIFLNDSLSEDEKADAYLAVAKSQPIVLGLQFVTMSASLVRQIAKVIKCPESAVFDKLKDGYAQHGDFEDWEAGQ